MIKLSLVIGIVCLSLAQGGAASDIPSPDRDQVHIDLAKNAILVSIMNAASPVGRYACSKQSHACAGPDKAELGLAILESKKTERHAAALIDLIALKTDGAVAEEFSCALIYHGEAIKKLLPVANPEALRSTCLADVKKIQKQAPHLYADMAIAGVCLDTVAIKAKIVEYIAMVNRNTTCDP